MTWLAAWAFVKNAAGGLFGFLDCATRVELTLLLQVGLVSFLLGFECSEIVRFTIYLQHRAPSLVVSKRSEELVSVLGAWLAPILAICARRNIAKIAKSVVGFVAVDVVDLLFGRDSSNILPSKAMREAAPARDTNNDVSIRPQAAGHGTCCDRAASHTPGKNTGFRIIRQKRAQNPQVRRRSTAVWHDLNNNGFAPFQQEQKVILCPC